MHSIMVQVLSVMKHRDRRFISHIRIAVVCAVCFSASSGTLHVIAGLTTRAQAIAAVREILDRSRSSCRIDRVQSISAVQSGRVWRVTARFVMSASGRPVIERAVWNVRVSDGKAVAANQLASEVENGCP